MVKCSVARRTWQLEKGHSAACPQIGHVVPHALNQTILTGTTIVEYSNTACFSIDCFHLGR